VLRHFGASKKVAVERFQLFQRGGMKHGHKEEFYRADEERMLATEEWVAETITRLGKIPRGARPQVKSVSRLNGEELLRVTARVSGKKEHELRSGRKTRSLVEVKEAIIVMGRELNQMPIAIASILFVVVSCFAGQHVPTKIKMQSDVRQMKANVLKRIPIGTHLQEANRVMEQNDFTCKIKEDSSFVEYLDETTEKVHEGKDFLWCHKSMRIKPLTLRRWQVIIVYEHDAVSELYVSSGITAP